jgi:DNA-binding NarL/FixJ family response regulator
MEGGSRVDAPAPIRVLFLEDDRGVAEATRLALMDEGIAVTAIEATVASALAALASDRPEVVVADIDLADNLALDLPLALGADGPPILWWSGHGDRFRVPALRSGGEGYVSKRDGLSALVAGIRRVAAGERLWTQSDQRQLRGAPSPPTPREAQVLAGVAAARQNKEIAAELGITERTVESHLRRMYDRYGCSSRIEILSVARQWGWIGRG